MPNNWKTYKLEELAERVTVGFVGSMAQEYINEGIPMLRSQNIKPFSLDFKNLKYISQRFHKKIIKSSLKKDDVAIIRTGNPGTACVIPDGLAELNCSDLVIVTPDKSKINPHFLCFYFNSIAGNYVNSQLVGAVQQHFNVGSAKQMEIKLPAVDEQAKIVSVLKNIQDKIELNLQTNKTLEEMAMTLYKHWFVDFGPSKNGEFVDSELGMIPKGWEVKRLEDILEVGSSKRIFLKEYVDEGIPFYRGKEIIQLSKGTNISTELFISYGRFNEIKEKFGVPLKNDILISSVGTIGVSWLVENSDPFYFKDGNLTWFKNYNEQVNGNFISQWLKSKETQEQIKSETIGSTQQALTISCLRKLKIILPPADSSIIQDITKELILWHELFVSNKKEIETLTTLRDTILPKLISGEVRVKDAEKILTEAL